MLKSGKIIFLNGVTSSGKSTIASAIQSLADENYYHLSNDMFHMAASEKYWEANHLKCMAETVIAMYYAAAALARNGFNIVIDGMLFELEAFVREFGGSNYDIMRRAMSGLDMLMVEVFCPLDECRRRNLARGDRGEHQSEAQHKIMNRAVAYDLRVDTTVLGAEDCAREILSALSAQKKQASI